MHNVVFYVDFTQRANCLAFGDILAIGVMAQDAAYFFTVTPTNSSHRHHHLLTFYKEM